MRVTNTIIYTWRPSSYSSSSTLLPSSCHLFNIPLTHFLKASHAECRRTASRLQVCTTQTQYLCQRRPEQTCKVIGSNECRAARRPPNHMACMHARAEPSQHSTGRLTAMLVSAREKHRPLDRPALASFRLLDAVRGRLRGAGVQPTSHADLLSGGHSRFGYAGRCTDMSEPN
jgi:hypothetical protein